MTDAATADRRIADRFGSAFGPRDDVGERSKWSSGMGGDDVGRSAYQEYRIKVFLGVVGQSWQHERIGPVVVEDEEPGASVGRRFRHRGRTDAAGRSGAIVDNDVDAKTLLQSVLGQPRNHVCGPCRWVGHYDANVARRPSLRQPRTRPGNCRSEKRNEIARSEEHTSELQSHLNIVCRLLLEKK